MSRLKLLILDANVVIYLHELGVWQKLISASDVHLARTVVADEAVYYEADGENIPIDLSGDERQARIQEFEVSLADIVRFRDQFDPVYVGELDPGETESLAFLTQSKGFLIASGDAIVYRVLGRLNRSDQGISLEEILQKVGLQRADLPWPAKKAFRERYTRQGETDAIQGIGLKRKKK